ncbi:MAG: septal ring lytic transglycosylase RlpA family protein [Desulfuromonadaceae bacterium]|nr:septal ring lytic transglycosylase RlpA family protein [Desulfuromonadaceae bacterium]MDD2855765.1 septal ring lytic transglycosylase RlpA family protein [Desulfuromonadaceae bacterium]
MNSKLLRIKAAALSLALSVSIAQADNRQPDDILNASTTQLEELVSKSAPYEPVKGYASYYARRFEGRRTTSGQRYNPDKMTAAHESLPIGTIVRVVNLGSRQEVCVTVNDRCASKGFHFIDLSRAAAKKIGLWGKGKIKVEIIPLLEDKS